ncbi:MAG TPA: radical SAM family heme chaperone HemW [Candidatus Eisenbacteria bacterium]|nr:radical SAM family heme chaperone HemW [Candidatus Eisenbacteria bacterium]
MHRQPRPFSLYIHIPYCISKCPYCDFNSHVVSAIPEEAYAEALTAELTTHAAREPWLGRSVQTVFFGGGTPSTFHPATIDRILDRTAALFDLDPNCEITLEANPGTVDRARFSGYRAAGVNRISVGIQSFQPRLLQLLGRAHSAEEAKAALEAARSAGFDNFSLDLIYANPGQTLEELAADLQTALRFEPRHVSAYNLTIEEGTPFYREFRSGRLQVLDEEQEIAMAERVETTLAAAGLARYEISNYARRGFESRHNLNYWEGGDYLGVGAGAHSYHRETGGRIYGRRWWNEKNPGRYMTALSTSGDAVAGREQSSLPQAAGEFMFSGLRLMAGIDLAAFTERFGKTVWELYPRVSTWVEEGFVESDDRRLRLTRRGLLVANSIFEYFV